MIITLLSKALFIVENIAYISEVLKTFHRVSVIRFLMPCKHLFAVLEHVEGKSWESVSSRYRASPFIVLDQDVVKHQDSEVPISPVEQDGVAENRDNEEKDKMVYSKLPMKQFTKRSKASECRDLLNQLRSLTFIVYDVDSLDILHDTLADSLKTLSFHAPKEDDLIVERPMVSRASKENVYPELPKTKERKSVLSGRIGVSTEKRKASMAVDVGMPAKCAKVSVIEEFPSFNSEDIYDIPMHSDAIIVDSDEYEDDDDVVVTGVVESSRSSLPKRPKRRRLKFSEEEKSTIADNHMLTDESINIAQNILHEQFPNLGGLQDTVVGKIQSFDVVSKSTSYIQILHVGSLHWVCVANMKNDREFNDYCQVYDSLAATNLHFDITKQIAAFLYCQTPELVVDVVPVQQQLNGVDCGVFAIAFATSLAFNEDPCAITFDSELIRPHLIKCLQEERMRPFPRKSKRARRCKTKVNVIELYCSCHMPYTEGDEMVECSNCKHWFHLTCEHINKKVLKQSVNSKWLCDGCVNR